MTNMLAEIFIEYGKSSNMFIITIAMIFFIIGLIFGVAAIVLTVLNKFNWIDFYFYCISLLSLIGFLVVFLVGIIRVGNDVLRNIETAIRKEYADVNFLQTGITGQFISNGNTYEYEIKDKKINIYLAQPEKKYKIKYQNKGEFMEIITLKENLVNIMKDLVEQLKGAWYPDNNRR